MESSAEARARRARTAAGVRSRFGESSESAAAEGRQTASAAASTAAPRNRPLVHSMKNLGPRWTAAGHSLSEDEASGERELQGRNAGRRGQTGATGAEIEAAAVEDHRHEHAPFQANADVVRHPDFRPERERGGETPGVLRAQGTAVRQSYRVRKVERAADGESEERLEWPRMLNGRPSDLEVVGSDVELVRARERAEGEELRARLRVLVHELDGAEAVDAIVGDAAVGG